MVGAKVCLIAFNLFYGGKQMCHNADKFKLYISKKQHGVFFNISPGQSDMKIWTSKTLLLYRKANQNFDSCAK